MATRIKLATTDEELHQVFRLRHEVFVDEEGFMSPQPDREISDRHDYSERTLILMALVDGELAGTIRLTLDGGLGTSADDYYDFGRYLPVVRTQVGSGSQLCLHRRHRASRQLFRQLTSSFYTLAATLGVTHLKSVFNPGVERLFTQAGWRPAGREFFSEKCGLPCLAMTLELSQLSLLNRNFIARHFREFSYNSVVRQFHAAGEVITEGGGIVGDAYEIVAGTVSVTQQLADGTESVQFLGPGDTFVNFGPGSQATAAAVEPVELLVSETAPATVAPSRLLADLAA